MFNCFPFLVVCKSYQKQGRGKLFYGLGSVKMSTMIGRRRQFSKIMLAKRPKTDHKNKFRSEFKWFKIFGVYLLISDFPAGYFKVNKRLAKKFNHFAINFCSKNLTHFTNLNFLRIAKNVLPQHSHNPYSLYKFSNKHVSGWCQKKHFYCIISRLPRTALLKYLESKCLYIPLNLQKKIFVTDT